MYVTLLVIERKKNGINYIFVHHINSIPGGGVATVSNYALRYPVPSSSSGRVNAMYVAHR